MTQDLFVNDLIEWHHESDSNLIERIIWIDEDYTQAFVVDINSSKGFPKIRTVSSIKEAITDGHALKLKSDPWSTIIREENISEKDKEIREQAWEIISFLVAQEPSIYYRHLRGQLIQDVIDQYNKDKNKDKLREKRIYYYLRKFWQRGKIKNALLPDYVNSGGRGKPKALGDKKRGRPRKYAHDQEIGTGVNVTEEDTLILNPNFIN
ncbi:hypothetical protein [Nostoc sp.]|uniref:hypothetical protein n=1 Tax=Nostoc sp. TaxID=1180 RepID=UPI002FF9F582